MVGNYEVIAGGPRLGFVFNGANYFSISFPDAVNTYPTAINNDGTVVGRYDQGNPLASGAFSFSPPYN